MATVIKTTFQLKRGTAARWKELNLTLAAGEPGFELDTGKLKIGNGSTPWNELEYLVQGGTYSAATIDNFPTIGNPDLIYKAINTKTLYQWNASINDYELLGSNGDSNIIIDTELSATSINPVQNKVITSALSELERKINAANGQIIIYESKSQFPETGDPALLYKEKSSETLYMWNSFLAAYFAILTENSTIDAEDLNVNTINGGNA